MQVLRRQHKSILLSRVWVTVDGILDCILDLLTTFNTKLEITLIAPSLMSTLYKSLECTDIVFSVCYYTSPGNISSNDYSSAPVLKYSLNGGSLPTASSCQSQSHIATEGQSVCLSVLVSSPGWGSWPDVFSCLKVTVLSMWGALSDERSGLSFVSHSR
jgi:hypothetical protein